MARYTHVLFDLDDTLFDFMAGARVAQAACADDMGVAPEAFWAIYEGVNGRWWERHREGEVGFAELRVGRMRETMEALGVSDPPPDLMAERYLERLGQQCIPLPGAEDLVRSLRDAGIPMGAVTNGLLSVQRPRFDMWALGEAFDFLLIAEETGRPKPDPWMISQALGQWGVAAAEVVLVGDSEAADGEAARRAGVEFVLVGEGTGAVPAVLETTDLGCVRRFIVEA